MASFGPWIRVQKIIRAEKNLEVAESIVFSSVLIILTQFDPKSDQFLFKKKQTQFSSNFNKIG
jgi:hypothetical protein